MIRAAGPSRRLALALAFLVTLLWSTSWVLIKIGVDDLGLAPLTFAGLRYSIAALILVPVALPALRRAAPELTRGHGLARVVILGVLLYAAAQGAQFAALVHLPAVAVGLVLSAIPVVVAFVGLRSGEPATRIQIVGTVAVVAGAALYFGPLELRPDAALGLALAAIAALASAASALLGRTLARDALPGLGGVLGMTTLSMASGALLLLAVGVLVEGFPSPTLGGWLIIGWLALVNTAFAFTLWNLTLRTLTAVESAVMNNLMLVQIAILAWIFLGETLDGRQLSGLALALGGVLAVQLGSALWARRRSTTEA